MLMNLVRRLEAKFDPVEDAGLTVFLALLCILSFVLLPALGTEGPPMSFLISLAYGGLLVLGAFLGDLPARWRAVALVLGAVSVGLTLAREVSPLPAVQLAYLVTGFIFLVLVCGAMLRQVFKPGAVNSHRLRGACAVYLLLGFVFAMVISMVEQTAPGAFSGLDASDANHLIRDAVYFSFVTLTTLGYGDITPTSDLARSLVIVEAVAGQLFLAILLARLVSMSVASGGAGARE